MNIFSIDGSSNTSKRYLWIDLNMVSRILSIFECGWQSTKTECGLECQIWSDTRIGSTEMWVIEMKGEIENEKTNRLKRHLAGPAVSSL